MKLRNNQHIRIGTPGGVLPSGGVPKTDYRDLIIRDIERIGEALRFNVDFGGRELHIYVRPKDRTGNTDLEIVWENQEKLIDSQFEDALDLEVYRDTVNFSALVVDISWLPLRDGGFSPSFRISEYVGKDINITPFDCEKVATEKDAEGAAKLYAERRLVEMYGAGVKFKFRHHRKDQNDENPSQ